MTTVHILYIISGAVLGNIVGILIMLCSDAVQRFLRNMAHIVIDWWCKRGR